MKQIITSTVFLLCCWSITAQSNSGQIKSQIRQILLLKTYIKYLEKGYEIAKKGLTFIGDIKRGDLRLHLDNFNSYKSVNPVVKKYAKVADVIALQVNIIQVYKQTISTITSSSLFSADEQRYVIEVFNSLIAQCGNNIDQLIEITTTGNYEMKDDERIERIDAITKDMHDKYAFAVHFGQGAQVMAIQKNNHQHEVLTSRLLFNIKNP